MALINKVSNNSFGLRRCIACISKDNERNSRGKRGTYGTVIARPSNYEDYAKRDWE